MKYQIFQNAKEMDNFLRKIPSKKSDNIEYGILKKYKKNRILFTAEHNVTSRIKTPKLGKESFIRIGDKNTDKLALIMAYRIQSGFLMPKFSRVDADVCRPINDIGKNERLLVRVYNSDVKMTRFRIHKEKNFAPCLIKYHSIIEKLNSKALISVHGMREKRRPPDILLGFGKDYRIIGDIKKALKFKKLYKKNVDDVLKALKIKNKLKINISKWLFTGEKNYVLKRHVIDKKRFGIHIEFNKRGRIIDREFIRKDYQIAGQVLADTILEWL